MGGKRGRIPRFGLKLDYDFGGKWTAPMCLEVVPLDGMCDVVDGCYRASIFSSQFQLGLNGGERLLLVSHMTASPPGHWAG